LSTNCYDFLQDWDVSLAKKHFDFDSDPDRNPDPGILGEFLPLRIWGKIVRNLCPISNNEATVLMG